MRIRCASNAHPGSSVNTSVDEELKYDITNCSHKLLSSSVLPVAEIKLLLLQYVDKIVLWKAVVIHHSTQHVVHMVLIVPSCCA